MTTEKHPNGPTKAQIAHYWLMTPQGVHRLGKFIDYGEPSCFACDYYLESWDRWPTPERCWNQARLERAHLTPHHQGGPFTVENTVLLCNRCHRDSEWVGAVFGATAMLQWIRHHESYFNKFAREASWLLGAVTPESVLGQFIGKMRAAEDQAAQRRFREALG